MSATSEDTAAGAKLIGVSDALVAVNKPLLSNAPARKVPAVNLPTVVAILAAPSAVFTSPKACPEVGTSNTAFKLATVAPADPATNVRPASVIAWPAARSEKVTVDTCFIDPLNHRFS